MGLAEYTITQSVQTKTTPGGCLLQSLGLKDVGKVAVKQLAKQVGKAVLKKAVPYVGWGLFAIEMACCLTE